MCKFVAFGAQHDKMFGIVAVEQIIGDGVGMELQLIHKTIAFPTHACRLLAQCTLQAAHLSNMDGVQADVKEQAGQNEKEQARAKPGRQKEQ